MRVSNLLGLPGSGFVLPVGGHCENWRPVSVGFALPPTSLQPVISTAEDPSPCLVQAEIKTLFVGIDPGTNGGLAFIRGGSYAGFAMPGSDAAVWEWLHHVVTVIGAGCRVQAGIEKVGGFMGLEAGENGEKEKRNKASAHTMFRFGASYGGLRMALAALEALSTLVKQEFIWWEVLPREWQRGLRIAPRAKGESKKSYKNRLKEAAQGLFQRERVTLATADALLIAEYLRRTTKAPKSES